MHTFDQRRKMKKNVIIILLVLLTINAFSQSVEVIKLPDLLKKIDRNNDTVYMANFWATWCAPCVKELPEFERLNLLYKKKKFRLILISLDFKKDIGRVISFVNKNNLASDVVLLDETKYHEWIDKIDSSWGGAIPATLILKGSEKIKKFQGNALDFYQLETLIKPLL